ncbi:ABC transporter ATP-binding protein [Spiroplasma culicicola]|uniref:ABC transporter ATP-binding protein/permease n=1 Tax=Spiroplasma culicicola AES-1 TaxID=1276246 RepID=W6A6J4_9MOLU|nr:ABC transporter ATP-binding protein/permease [Spiroplasma culicicola]AHI52591.1 ABC transporter ATP-binding protein/permease [Spiroplasma culicicola AES-1]
MQKTKKFQSEKAFSKKKFLASMKMIGLGIKKHPIHFVMLFIINTIDSVLFSSTVIIVNGLTKAINNTVDHTSSFFGFFLTWEQWIYVALVIYLLFICSEYATNFLSQLFSKKVEILLRQKALQHLVEIDISYYSKTQIGLIMSRVINDTQGVGDAFNEFFLNIVYMISSLITTLIIVYQIDVPMAAIVTGWMVFMIIIIWVIFIYYRRALITAVDERQAIDADITDRLINVRLIKSTGSENRESQRNIELHKKYDVKQKKVVNLQAILVVFNNTMAWMLPSIMIIISIFMYEGKMSSGDLAALITSFTSACFNLLTNLMVLTITMRGLTKMANCVMRLNYIYEVESIIDFDSDPKTIKSIDSVEFKNVSFTYPESPKNQILPEINIVFEKGKSYAFVGETGVGKSTIAKMLLRFYDVTTGQLLINNIDIKKLDLPNYLSHVGYVEQEPQILYGTVLENIKYSLSNVTDEQVIDACKKAKLHNYIMGLPDKYETILGERGFMFSGGQKQRLVIARLFLKDPQLLILDEATSALDNIVEKEIQKELDELMKNRTTIVIAHRLSTIKNVDQIVVLERNIGIGQMGTFKELKDKPGRFQKLYTYGLLN